MKFISFLISAIFFISLCIAQCNSGQVDINSASISELDKLVDIGPARAQYIIDARPYTSLEDLDRAKDIGPSRLAKIKEQGLACVGSETYSEEDNLLLEESSNKEDEREAEKSEQVEEKITSRVIEETYVEQQKSSEIAQTESIINLNSDDTSKKKVIYESRNELIRKYSVYVFIVFLLIVISFLLLKRNERTEDCSIDDY
jgi:hypothetical protein